jgi:hypothetical protein
MKFPYVKFPLERPSEVFGKAILKPIIPIKIKVKENSLDYNAVIDSGADFCIFDAEVGEYLGLNIKSGIREEFGGVVGSEKGEVFFHKVILNVGGWDYETIVGFSYEIAKFGFGILGQKGFFDIFVVKFDLSKEEIEIKPRIRGKI